VRFWAEDVNKLAQLRAIRATCAVHSRTVLENMRKPKYRERGQLSSGDMPERLRAKHWARFPKHVDPTASRLRPSKPCRVCQKNKKRRETTWECEKRKVPLHLPECFELCLTVADY
jgi:hypothetical protein